MNKAVVKYMFIVLITILIIVAIASYRYLKSDNVLGPNLITAFVGVVVSALVTLVLLNGQTKDEEEKERNLKLYNAKLKVYSNFASTWHNALKDGQITSNELRDLRTMLFGKVFFYVENKDVFIEIEKELKSILEKKEDTDANDPKLEDLFSKIVFILQKDLNGLPIISKDSIFKKIFKVLFRKRKEMEKDDYQRNNGLPVISKDSIFKKIFKALFRKSKKMEKDDYQRNIRHYLNKIIENSEGDGNQPQELERRNENGVLLQTTENAVHIQTENEQNPISEEQRLPQPAWHFIMWNDTQLKKLKDGFNELSLIEYGEYWRTNLVKQVGENDIVLLYRRGGSGYIGAYKAIGWRVFYFEEYREDVQLFGKNKLEIKGEQYISDIKKYDIYESGEDGATTCANIIVEPIAFVEEGVGNPGGVYRRTISRYDSHYAWLLQKEFQKKGQWKE